MTDKIFNRAEIETATKLGIPIVFTMPVVERICAGIRRAEAEAT